MISLPTPDGSISNEEEEYSHQNMSDYQTLHLHTRPLQLLSPHDEMDRMYYIPVDKEEWKAEALCEWLDVYGETPDDQVIVFVNSKLKLDWICQVLKSLEYPVEGLVRSSVSDHV